LFRRKYTFLIFLFFCSFFSRGQVDSLIQILPQIKGEKKILTLCDISYFYSGHDPVKGMYYGRLALKEAKHIKNQKLILQALNDMSISYLNGSKYDSVIILANEAIKIATNLKDDVSRAKAYNRISMAYFERGLHKESIEYNFKALRIFEKENQIQYQGLILTNIGASYEKLGLLDDALAIHLKVLDLAKKTNSSEMFSSAYGNLGIVYMKKGDYQLADQHFLKALNFIDQNTNQKGLSILYQNIGVNARSMGDSKKGVIFYKKALDLYRENQDRLGSGYIYFNLANCMLDLGQLNEASLFIDSGFVLAKQLESLPLTRDAYRALSRMESLKGNFSQADIYFEEYEKYKDSILNLEKVKAVSEIQSKYNLEKKEKDLMKEKASNEAIKKQLYAFGGLSVSLALLLFLFWQRHKLKLRKKEIESLERLTDERNRIARDLHDNLGAELTIVSSKIDTKIYKTEKQKDKEELEIISDLTRNAGIILRETVWSIKNEALTVRSLKDKIEEYIQRIDVETTIDFEIIVNNENTELTPMVALNFYRIIQEGISNILKYARASLVKITISENFVNISDNGCGFDPLLVKKGYGLNNMEARTKEMGGELAIKSNQKGTSIEITIKR
jgi:signal transduction histidine kinase